MKYLSLALAVLLVGCQGPSTGGPSPLGFTSAVPLYGHLPGNVGWSYDGNRAIFVQPEFFTAKVTVGSAEAPSWSWQVAQTRVEECTWGTPPSELLRCDQQLLMVGWANTPAAKSAYRRALDGLSGQSDGGNLAVLSSADQGRTWATARRGPVKLTQMSAAMAVGSKIVLAGGTARGSGFKRQDGPFLLAVSEDEGKSWTSAELPLPKELKRLNIREDWRMELDPLGRLHLANFPVLRDDYAYEEKVTGLCYLRSTDLKEFDVVEFTPRPLDQNDNSFALGSNGSKPQELYRLYVETTVDENALVKDKTSHLMVQISKDGGEDWGRPFELGSTGASVMHPRIKGYGELLVASWEEVREKKGQILTSASADGGRSWSAPEKTGLLVGDLGGHRLSVGPKGALYVTSRPDTVSKDERRLQATIGALKP